MNAEKNHGRSEPKKTSRENLILDVEMHIRELSTRVIKALVKIDIKKFSKLPEIDNGEPYECRAILSFNDQTEVELDFETEASFHTLAHNIDNDFPGMQNDQLKMHFIKKNGDGMKTLATGPFGIELKTIQYVSEKLDTLPAYDTDRKNDEAKINSALNEYHVLIWKVVDALEDKRESYSRDEIDNLLG